MNELTEHIEALRRYAFVLSRDRAQAEDLVQECLVRAIEGAAGRRPGSPLRPWLLRILHNAHVSQVRKNAVRGRVLDAGEANRAADGDQIDRLELQDLLAALDRLPDGQREAVVLMALEDLPYRQAAQVLGIPLGTFMSRLSRGRRTLRALMSGDAPPRLSIVGVSS
jgi:RNA polymerase sigma-70 factor, ECF subfamily